MKCWESKNFPVVLNNNVIYFPFYRYIGHKTEDMNIESAVNINDNYILSGSITGELWFWDLVSANVAKKLCHTKGKVLNSISVHPRKDVLLTASVNTIKLWGSSEDMQIDNLTE